MIRKQNIWDMFDPLDIHNPLSYTLITSEQQPPAGRGLIFEVK